jgi:hypothetical protein
MGVLGGSRHDRSDGYEPFDARESIADALTGLADPRPDT